MDMILLFSFAVFVPTTATQVSCHGLFAANTCTYSSGDDTLDKDKCGSGNNLNIVTETTDKIREYRLCSPFCANKNFCPPPKSSAFDVICGNTGLNPLTWLPGTCMLKPKNGSCPDGDNGFKGKKQKVTGACIFVFVYLPTTTATNTLTSTLTTTSVHSTTLTTTTQTTTSLRRFKFVAGPRLHGAVERYCSMWSGSADEAKFICSSISGCTVVASLDCGPSQWRYCTYDLHTLTTAGGKCSQCKSKDGACSFVSVIRGYSDITREESTKDEVSKCSRWQGDLFMAEYLCDMQPGCTRILQRSCNGLWHYCSSSADKITESSAVDATCVRHVM